MISCLRLCSFHEGVVGNWELLLRLDSSSAVAVVGDSSGTPVSRGFIGNTMSTITITIPQGASPGDTLVVDYNGKEINFTVPAGAKGGDTFEIKAPDGANVSKTVSVAIPEGASAGDTITVSIKGNEFHLTVPEGAWTRVVLR